MNTNVSGNPMLTAALYSIGIILYLGWFVVLGQTLAKFLPRQANYSLNWFLIDVFIVLAAFCAVAILTDNHSYQAEGLAAIPVFYLFFAVGHVFWFPAVTLVAIEKQRKPEFGFYFGTLLLMLFWPIGVWFIQPRLNRIYAAIQADTFDYPRP
ncbi:hypothetical protein F0P96_19850 [Hymenobacter busanensis]|uniref:Uncharacterized protein n=1 Tax=Hymenobacter busanensis TaxID=2607656 RepID=A0A7L4ZY33_9BACT|nr:hypothetical protein [Hymenobacter busanensis]KAA9325583.1 hypothetical protein F0P96_19850 [Hymenobacter busanensis]QHJ07745.1 hypothetical protein GUY19_10815 [Hymenobacter busanensis]